MQQNLARLASLVVGYLAAAFAGFCLIIVTLYAVYGTLYPRVTYTADSNINDVIGFLLYLAPIILCIGAGLFIARAVFPFVQSKLQYSSTGMLASIIVVSVPLALILTLTIALIGLFAWFASRMVPEQVMADISGYTVIFRQDTDLEFTTLMLEMSRADGFVAGETIDSDGETICRRLVIKQEDNQLHLICERTDQSDHPNLRAYIDIERKEIYIDSNWHQESRIPFDQLYFYKP